MKRPKIKIDLDTSDHVMEIMGVILIMLMFAWPIYYFNELPELIPSHYNASGEPDDFSQKNMIWILPIIGLLMYVGMYNLNKYPHSFNFPKEITEENAAQQYRLATKLIRTLNVLIAASFFYIIFSTIQTGLNKQDGLGPMFVPIFILFIFGTIGSYMYLALKRNR